VRTRRFPGVRGIVLLLVAGALAGCAESPGFNVSISVTNKTAVPLHFTIVRTDGVTATIPTDVPAGAQMPLISGGQLDASVKWVLNNCTVGPLIAYGPDGLEMARHAPPLCASNNTIWIIGGTGTPAPPVGSDYDVMARLASHLSLLDHMTFIGAD
jgi:hypothetical protein